MGDDPTKHYNGTMASDGSRCLDTCARQNKPFVTTIEEGDGKTYPKVGDELTVHYTGTLASDGSCFDSSVKKNKPFVFKIGIGEVSTGWDEGVMQMSLGEKATLAITSDEVQVLGAEGEDGVIPPNAVLNFEVHVLAIGNQKAPEFKEGGGGCAIL